MSKPNPQLGIGFLCLSALALLCYVGSFMFFQAQGQHYPQRVVVNIVERRTEDCDFLPALATPAVFIYGYSEGYWFDVGQLLECKHDRRNKYHCTITICNP